MDAFGKMRPKIPHGNRDVPGLALGIAEAPIRELRDVLY